MAATTPQLVSQIRKAGYEALRVEQPRPNRWVLSLRTPEGAEVVVLAQERALVGAADVQDLAELLRLRRVAVGYLLALGGRFSAEAQRTAQEGRQGRILLCTALPSTLGASSVTALEPARR